MKVDVQAGLISMNRQIEYTDIIPQEPGYYWVTRKKFGVWQMAEIFMDHILFDDEDVLIISIISPSGAIRPLDDFCNSVDDTFLWIGPIEKPEDLEIE